MSTTDTTETPAKTGISASLQNLPSPPFVAMEIIRLTNNEDSDASDLAEVINSDPVLAARLLQIANSPSYGLAREVSSVERATALLGLKAVKMMALSFSLASSMKGDSGPLPLETYWYHSLLNAAAARRWAEMLNPGLSEESFLSGLLSHLGRLVLAGQCAAQYQEVMDATEGDWPSHESERQVFGFSSADVTAEILDSWGLPEIVVQGTGSMYRAEQPLTANGAEPLAAVLELAVITETALSDRSGPGDVDALTSAGAEAGIGADEVDEFVVDLEGRVRGLADSLEVELPDGVSHLELLDEARNRLVAVSLEAAMNLQTAEQTAEDLREANVELDQMAHTDRLTGVPNRAAFDDHLARVVSSAVRKGEGAVGVLLLDIDHFKSFNDTYGHQLGDEVLRRAAQAMKGVTRGNELFARYGGEEFALVVTECKPSDLIIAGNRLREAVERMRVPSEAGPLAVTISGGAAHIDSVSDQDAGERLTKLADEALYAAKANGRNQVCGIE